MGPKVDPEGYYKSFCGDVKDPLQRERCKGYIDQCVAHLEKIGDRDQSTYGLVSVNGKKIEKLDFDRCLGFAKTMSIQGDPAKVVKGGTGEPDPKKVDGGDATKDPKLPTKKSGEKKTAVPKCKASDYGTGSGGKPGWVGSDAHSYGAECFYSKPGDEFYKMQLGQSEMIAEVAAQTKLIGDFCVPGKKDFDYHDFYHGPKPKVEKYVEHLGDKTCVHVFLEWREVSCTSGEIFVCE